MAYDWRHPVSQHPASQRADELGLTPPGLKGTDWLLMTGDAAQMDEERFTAIAELMLNELREATRK